MSTTARQQQKGRKNEPQAQANRRPPNAWGQPNRNSGAYSPAPNTRPLANNASSTAPAASSNTSNTNTTAPTNTNTNTNAGSNNGPFPPLNGSSAPSASGSTPASRSDAERTLQSLAGLTGTTVTVSLRNGPRFEGVVDSTAQQGDTPGLTLRDARDVNFAGSPIKDRQFIAAANIASWLSGPAGTKPTTAPNGDSFKTDVDISFKTAPRRERELQAWADDSVGLDLSPGGANHSPGATIGHGDDTTFGTGASRNTGWDQFATNEKLFGVKAGFDEEAYTTKLNRDAPDFKERERKAQQLANEIMNSGTHNSHIAEERVMNLTGDNGINEEDKHAAVVRSPGAYVPPAARKGSGGPAGIVNLPKVSVNAPDGTPAPLLSANANATRTSGPPSTAGTPAATATSTSTSTPTPAAAAKGAAGAGAATPEGAFRDFVSHEKKRLAEKKQTMMRKDMEARFADLMSFSKSFKLKQPLPEDLVPILAKDEDKQAAIRDKALADASAAASAARSPGASAAGPIAASHSSTNTFSGAGGANAVRLDAAHAKAGGIPASVSTKTPVPAKPVDKKKPAMFIQAIPAFKGSKKSAESTPAGGSSAAGSAVVSPSLNQNAPSFRPNPKAVAFSPPGGAAAAGSGAGGKQAQAQGGPSPKPARAGAVPDANAANAGAATHPFFGRPPKKPAGPVSIRDDFNPFKHNKPVEPAAVGNNWPYSGKRFMHHYPNSGPSNTGGAGAGGPGGGGAGGPGGPGGPGPMQNGMQMVVPNALGVGVGMPGVGMPPPGAHPHIQVPTPGMPGVPLPGVGGPPGGPGNITASPNMAHHIMQQQPGGPQGPGGPGGFEEDPAQAAARAAAQAQAQAQAGQYMFYPPHYYPGQPMMQGMPPPGPPGAYMPGPYMQMYPPMGPNGQPMYAASPQMGQMPLPPPYGMPPPGAYPPPNGQRPSMPPTPMPHNAHAHTYYQPSPQMQHAMPYPMMMPPPGQQMGVPPGGPGAPPPGQGPPPPQGHYEQPGQGGPQQMGVPHA